jgi:uncharacterized membrane protein
LLYWVVLTRFHSGQINGIDFTVFFDRPCFQTAHGRPLFVETAGGPEYAARSLLAVHAFWALLPVGYLYALWASPQWLLGLSVIAVVAGAMHTLRIMERLGAGGPLACATALAFLLNANTARTLNYGFHPEVLYAWFVPWLIDAALTRRRASFVAATLACLLVKEDACLPLFAASVAVALHRFRAMTRGDRALFLALPTILAVLNLGVFYRWVVPALTMGGSPMYANYWATYGATPLLALSGMLAHPWRVMADTLTSGFFRRVLVPHLYLPLVGWRWTLGAVPIVALYGAATNAPLRDYGVYYSIIVVPFLVLGTSSGALMVTRRLFRDPGRARLLAAGGIFLSALLVGSTDGGYSLRPWRTEISALPETLRALAGGDVLVQSGLYPHAGYEQRIKLLTPAALSDPKNAGAIAVLAPAISAYPFRPQDLAAILKLPSAEPAPAGLVIVRIPAAKHP